MRGYGDIIVMGCVSFLTQVFPRQYGYRRTVFLFMYLAPLFTIKYHIKQLSPQKLFRRIHATFRHMTTKKQPALRTVF